MAIDDTIAKAQLWQAMLEYYRPRIDGYYIPNLLMDLQACQNSIREHNEPLSVLWDWLTFQELHQLSTHKTVQTPSALIMKAYEIRSSPSFRWLMRGIRGNSSPTKRLWISICFLGRLRETYLSFIKVATALPAFGKIVIRAIRKGQKPKPPARALTLTEAFNVLGLKDDDETVRNHVRAKYTRGKAAKDFDNIQAMKPYIHCEVQVLLHLLQNDGLKDIFQYIGCSKRSCFMCWNLLTAHGPLRTRGCHGKLYSRWIIPETPNLTAAAVESLAEAIRQLENTLSLHLRTPVGKPSAQLAESSIGITASIDAARPGGRRSRNKLIEDSSSRTAGYFTSNLKERYRHLTEQRNPKDKEVVQLLDESTSESSCGVSKTTSKSGDCYHCERLTSRRCSRCQRDWFCCEACESHPRLDHIFKCAIGRPLNSADHLYLACEKYLLPEDPQTLEDFGFSQLPSLPDRSNLLGLYQGLLRLDVPSQTVHRWQVEKSLEKNIIKAFSSLPETSRGGYFPWFLQNKTKVFSAAGTTDESQVSRLFAEARLQLDPKDRDKNPTDLQPKTKQVSFEFYTVILNFYHPSPTLPSWYEFGFCVCNDEEEEGRLGNLYQQLIAGKKFWGESPTLTSEKDPDANICTFTEFWKAYESHTLIELMDSKGLHENRLENSPRHLEAFLRGGALSKSSVWELKLFLAGEEAVEPEKCVGVDYGFWNCRTFQETLDLKEVYREVLRVADPVDLHKACIAGELFNFASKHVKLAPRFRSLMRNLYPLVSDVWKYCRGDV